MADFCIPKELAEKLKQAAREGKIDIEKMYTMTSTQRRDLFKAYVDPQTAKQINAGFERAMISEQQTALKNWAERTFTGKENTVKRTDVIDKIDTLREMGVLTPENEDAFLTDLVASKLGATVTSEEAKVISEKAKKLEELGKDRTEFGTPTIEYFKARRDMENYLASLTPSSNLRVASETIGRGTMLLSIKSPLLNIESNTVQGLLQAAERRIVNMSLGGMNSGYAVRYIKYVNDVFSKSGYDISRMDSLSNGRKQLGEDVANSQGKGPVRALGRVYEDIVFGKLLSAPDVAYSSVHFADSANIASSKFARKEGLKGKAAKERALAIFKDATSLEPKTVEGTAVREQAKADSFYATYTNKSVYSDLGLGIRKLFNIPSADLRVGDQVMPFVKTPANVIGAGIDSSGILIPPDLALRMVNTLKGIHGGKMPREAAEENFKGFGRRLIRAGLGLLFAYLLSTLFSPDDFIGEYPVSEKDKQLLALKNATPNSVKIGGRWVSLDYFGPLGAPLVGFLYAKKYGKTLPEQAFRYAQGVGIQSLKIPGFNEFYNTIQSIKANAPDKSKSIGDLGNTTLNNVIDFIRSRTIPALVYDYAKARDPFERKVDYNKPADKVLSTIPGQRENLPIKYTIFGDNVKSEGWATLLFGARVKTASTDPLVTELSRLDSTDNLPSITDVSKTSQRAKELKAQIGDAKFDEAMRKFGKYFKADLTDLVNSDTYIRAEGDDERKKMIDQIKADTFDYILGEYKYQPVQKK